MIVGQSNQNEKRIVQLPPVRLSPTKLHRRMHAHKGDVSEGTNFKLLAEKNILGQRVLFYTNGLRQVKGIPLNDEEAHDSEILRFAHASLLISSPVGDKKKCYVDASKNPVEVWIYGMSAEKYIKGAEQCIANGADPGYFLDQSLQDIMEPSNG